MQIVLPPEIEDLVQRQLTSGKYQTAIEVILAGVKLLNVDILRVVSGYRDLSALFTDSDD